MTTTIKGANSRIVITSEVTKKGASRIKKIALYNLWDGTGVSVDRFLPFMLHIMLDMQNAGHPLPAMTQAVERVFHMRATGKPESDCIQDVDVFFTSLKSIQ